MVQKVLQSRWLIPAKQNTELEVVLQASALDVHRQNLDFEVGFLLLLVDMATFWVSSSTSLPNVNSQGT